MSSQQLSRQRKFILPRESSGHLTIALRSEQPEVKVREARGAMRAAGMRTWNQSPSKHVEVELALDGSPFSKLLGPRTLDYLRYNYDIVVAHSVIP